MKDEDRTGKQFVKEPAGAGLKPEEPTQSELEQRYRRIFENLVEGVFQSTPDGRLITVNPAMARMYGYGTPEEMVSGVRNIGQEIYTNSEDRRTFKKILEAEGVVKGFEAQFYRKDKTVLWGSLNVRAVKGASGAVLYYEGTMEDITARKRAEEAVRESESKYRTLFNTATDAIYLYEMNGSGMPGRFVEVSEVTCERLGYTREEMLSMTPGDIDAREAAADLPRIMKDLVRTGSARFELTHMTRDGKAIPVEISSRVLALKGQAMVLAIARDISGRKKAEEKLKRSEEKYRTIFENAVEGIFQATPDGRYLSVNPALARIHGFNSPEEMMASVTDIAHQLYVDPSRRATLKHLIEKDGSVRNFEIMMRRRDGSLHWVSNTAHAIRDDRGAILYYEGTTEDITARKFAEEELKQLKATLEGTLRAMSRTVELRDPGTKGHQERVSNLAGAIAREMGFSPDMAENIRKAGIIHDIGMMSVPAEILNRPGRLAEMEYNLVKVHPQSGFDIVKGAELPYPLPEMILQHHERLDGSGYPHGLKGNEILLEARILAVADVVEAMAFPRPYRPTLGIEAALREIAARQSLLYDAETVRVCIMLFKKKGFSWG
jgi:PAS domain S-box-containing protein